MTTTEITMHGHAYSAERDGDAVTIERDGHYAGTGRWADGIQDCPAELVSGDPDATEEVYAALDDGLMDGEQYDVTDEAADARAQYEADTHWQNETRAQQGW